MVLTKIISGGQTGADRAGLEFAARYGIPTGGWAPKGWLTEKGPDLSLRDVFGLKECPVKGYPPRTRLNAADSDGTVWFGKGAHDSRGFGCTREAVLDANKPWLVNPSPGDLLFWVCQHNIRVLNVAGNRASLFPQVAALTWETLYAALVGPVQRKFKELT